MIHDHHKDSRSKFVCICLQMIYLKGNTMDHLEQLHHANDLNDAVGNCDCAIWIELLIVIKETRWISENNIPTLHALGQLP